MVLFSLMRRSLNHMHSATPPTLQDDERLLRERRPNGNNADELLALLERTRDPRRHWIETSKPTTSAILDRYPRLLDLGPAVCSCICV
jgi:hypothetical protein